MEGERGNRAEGEGGLIEKEKETNWKGQGQCAEKGVGMERKEPERKSLGDRTEWGETEEEAELNGREGVN